MVTYKIIRRRAADAEKLVEKLEIYDFDVDAGWGHYIIDAKSLLGVMGLGIGKEIELRAYTSTRETLDMDLKGFLTDSETTG